MEQALALGSVIPAALGAGCCAAVRRQSWIVIVAMTLVVVAMLDMMMLGGSLLPSSAWAVVMTGSAIAVFLAEHGQPVVVRRAAHIGLMALLTVATLVGVGSTVSAQARPATHDHMQHAHPMASMSPTEGSHMGIVLVAAAVLLAVAWSAAELVRSWSCVRLDGGIGVVCAERALSAISLLAMSAMVVVMA